MASYPVSGHLKLKMKANIRISKHEYLMKIAEVAAERSEDTSRKVGAVAATLDGRVIATAYNGLPAGMEYPTSWESDDQRRTCTIHAEQNLCSLFKLGEVHTVYVTTEPCASCRTLLMAHGVQLVFYKDSYPNDPSISSWNKFYIKSVSSISHSLEFSLRHLQNSK